MIRLTLEALRNQTFKDFNVLIVLKPSGDETEAIVKEYRKYLNIQLILQKQGSFVDALNLGFRHANGTVIALVDDDAVPFPDWLEKHMEHYKDPNIGGVAGDVLPVILRGGRLTPVEGELSEIIPDPKSYERKFTFNVWNQPIEGLENCLVYVSKAGIVMHNAAISLKARRQPVNSILGMGANMSVLSKSVRDFNYSTFWVRGLASEQYLGLYLWRQGLRLVFDPAAKVSHISHGVTLSRSITNEKIDVLCFTENNLLFYRLYGIEPSLTIMHRIVWLVFDAVVNIKKFCIDKEVSQLARLKSKFYSECIGLKWRLSRRLGLNYSPSSDLKKLENWARA